MRFSIASLLIAVALATVVVRLAIWEPMLGGLAAAAWLGGAWSQVASRDPAHAWLRGALAGMFWFAVSPLVIVMVVWIVAYLPIILFGSDSSKSTAIISDVAVWAPYAQSIASGIAGGLTATWPSRRRGFELVNAADAKPLT
jgi:hypothetical protein